jgi:GAF domain-containing protein
MAVLAQDLHRTAPLEEVLAAIAEGARDNVPGVDYAGISIRHRGGRIETVAATDPIVYKADSLQYDLNEGPCVDAIHDGGEVLVEDLREDHRWPRYAPAAEALGIAAQLGVQLHDDNRAVGGLNLYARQPNTFDADSLQMAHLFAIHAASALGRAMTRTDMTKALESRTIIAQAVGIVMERYKINAPTAFAFLTRTSQTRNVKLRTIAEQLIDNVAQHKA